MYHSNVERLTIAWHQKYQPRLGLAHAGRGIDRIHKRSNFSRPITVSRILVTHRAITRILHVIPSHFIQSILAKRIVEIVGGDPTSRSVDCLLRSIPPILDGQSSASRQRTGIVSADPIKIVIRSLRPRFAIYQRLSVIGVALGQGRRSPSALQDCMSQKIHLVDPIATRSAHERLSLARKSTGSPICS